MTCDEVRGKLVPYVDSELPAGELTEFDSHLRGCASCAADALGLLQTKLATRAAGTRYVPSPEFRLRMEQSMRAGRKPSWINFRSSIRFPKLAIAAAAAMLLIASVTLWVHHSAREHELTEIADLHVAELASANPVDVVSTDRHTVKPWFAGKLPFSFNLPELQNSAFTLAGGRVAYFQHSPGAQLLFNVRKHQLSVFIFQEEAGEFPAHLGTATATRLALHIETWSEGGLRYFIVSDAPAPDVHALGELLRNAARS
jgi:anti-sigma factor RsiW